MSKIKEDKNDLTNNCTEFYCLWLLLKIVYFFWYKEGNFDRQNFNFLSSGRKAMTNLDCILKCREITLLTKVCIVKSMSRCELDHKKGWVLKNWCFQTVVLAKILESPLDSKEIKLVNPKGSQPWIIFGRTD